MLFGKGTMKITKSYILLFLAFGALLIWQSFLFIQKVNSKNTPVLKSGDQRSDALKSLPKTK